MGSDGRSLTDSQLRNRELEIRAAVANSCDEPFATESLWLSPPAANELLIRLVSTSVCHTDVMTKNEGLCTFPIVLGHEGAGVVEALGDDVTGYDVGDHVVLSYDFCGRCPQCTSGKPSYCNDHGSLNFAGTRPDGRRTHRRNASESADVYGSFFQQSSFSTYALSHASNTVKVDNSLPLAQLAPLGCGVQTGAGTVFNTLQAGPGTSLAVFGCGCVGLSAIMAAKVAGAADIIAVDINPDRLRLASDLGATATLNPNDVADAATVADNIRSMARTGGCHYAIDTTGQPAVLRQAFESCGPLGVTAMIAPNVPGTEVSIEMLGLLPGKSLRGVVQGDSVSKSFLPTLIDLWQQGRFPFDRMITRFEGLDSIETAVQAMRRGDVVKPVVILDPDYAD
jgi:aryl-alcohol dehydrogenase